MHFFFFRTRDAMCYHKAKHHQKKVLWSFFFKKSFTWCRINVPLASTSNSKYPEMWCYHFDIMSLIDIDSYILDTWYWPVLISLVVIGIDILVYPTYIDIWGGIGIDILVYPNYIGMYLILILIFCELRQFWIVSRL